MEKGKPHSTKKGRIISTYREALRSTNKMLELAHKLKNKDRLTQRDIERAEKLTKGVGLANALKNKDRLTTRDIERAEKLAKSFGSGITDSAPKVIDKMLKMIQKDKSIVGKKKGGVMEKGKPHSTRKGRAWAGMRQSVRKAREYAKKLKEDSPKVKEGKAKAKEHKQKLKNLADKGIGYVKGWVGKKKGGKVKRGCANGGTVVMPTVGNDVRVRAYKHGALIHPRPRPTTVLHGRERARGVGIAKRGW